MVPVLQNSKFILHKSTLRLFPNISPNINSHRLFITSNISKNDSEDGTNKAEEARRKLQQLLRETRSNKHLQKGASDKDLAPKKKVKLVKPHLNKFSDKSETENVKGLDPRAVYAANRVAASLNKNKDHKANEDEDKRQFKVRKIESDLLRKLKVVHNETEEAKIKGAAAAPKDLKSLFSSLQVEKDPESEDKIQLESETEKPIIMATKRTAKKELTQEQIAFLEKRRRLRQAQQVKDEEEAHVPIDIFNSQPPLGIFSKGEIEKEQSSPQVKLTMWDKCQEREMKILSSSAPKNLLEEMAIKTDQGILWEFPINNEQGIDQDKIEPFHAHVFLDHHLESWCPKKGPVRHFMELVCVGLSKNPYITVEKKIEHIHWYKEYFENPEHNEILKISGAIE